MKSRIGLALGGGGVRGIAHLGVWQRLRELGVEFHCIAGTSIGAMRLVEIGRKAVENDVAEIAANL